MASNYLKQWRRHRKNAAAIAVDSSSEDSGQERDSVSENVDLSQPGVDSTEEPTQPGVDSTEGNGSSG